MREAKASRQPSHFTKSEAPPRRQAPPSRAILGAFLVGLIVLAVALPVLRNQFVDLDDGLYLGNSAVASGLSPRSVLFALTSVTDLYWHPLTWLSHAADVQFFGMNPAGHHFTSALLHAVSAALLFLLLKRLGAGTLAGAAGSLFWALHPLRVESFAWIAERRDVLCAVFLLAALLAYLHHAARPSRRRYLTTVVHCTGPRVAPGIGILNDAVQETVPCLLFDRESSPLLSSSVVRPTGARRTRRRAAPPH